MFIKNSTINYQSQTNQQSQGEKKMYKKAGKIRFLIAPTRNNGDYLYYLLRVKFPSSHLYFDGYFIYLTTYANHSYALLKRIKDIDEVKSVFLDEEIKLERKEKIMNSTFATKNNNSPEICTKIKIIPSKEINRTLLFEALFSSFPEFFVILTDDYFILTGKAERENDLIVKIQAIQGVDYAHNA